MANTSRQLSIVLLLLLASLQIGETNLYNVRKLKAQGRTLTFPITAPTRLQFIGGIGIPVEDLAFESVTSGYVLKAEYFLPTRADEFRPTYFRPQTIHRRRRHSNETSSAAHLHPHGASSQGNTSSRYAARQSSNSGANFKSKQRNASVYRWIIYSGIEVLLSRAGLPGRACVLRSICEHAALPLHHDSGLLGELFHIILTPSTSRDDSAKSTDNAYLYAEMHGRSGGSCELKFNKCSSSPIDQISTIFDLSNDLI